MSTIPSQTRLFQTATLKKSTVGGVGIRVSSPRRSTLAAIFISMLGCGGKSLTPQPDGGSADDASTRALCAVPTPTTPAPYAVQFQLHDDGDTPAFLLDSCAITFGVSSCAGGFRDHLNDFAFCACSCEHPQCGNECGGCAPDAATEIAPGTSTMLPWSGISTTIEPISTGGECVSGGNVPAGRYRFSITVYDSAADALARTGPRVVSQDFSLPAPNGVVDVVLAPSADDVCDPTPDVPVASCTGAEAHDVPCSLATGLSFAYVGGLSAFDDGDAIAPPNAFTLTRTYADRTKTPLTCAPKIPRCSRDARVVTTGDVTRALALPGVKSSFGPSTPVFGTDARESDGSIMIVTAPDGTSVGLGGPCPSCARPTTAGLNALRATLGTLSEQQRADVSCAAFGQ
ncbi:MAG TPA: hypothetical protein VH560_04240 [Polyangia bacterium]|nr:hypothetical protein [Polyangia bacterium]